MKKLTLIFTLFVFIGLLFAYKAAEAVYAEEAIILGRIFRKDSTTVSCPHYGWYFYGDNCGNNPCFGNPNYTVTWTQGENSNTVSNNSCWDGLPRYTFENTSSPEGDDDGELVSVKVTMDDPNARINRWNRSTSKSNGASCAPRESGSFPPSNSQEITITAYSDGDCKWNHVWFWYDMNLIPDCTGLNGPTTVVVNEPVTHTVTADGGESNAPVTTVQLLGIQNGSCSTPYPIDASVGANGPGSYPVTWTPTEEGPFTLYGMIYNDGIAACSAECPPNSATFYCTNSLSCKLNIIVVKPTPTSTPRPTATLTPIPTIPVTCELNETCTTGERYFCVTCEGAPAGADPRQCAIMGIPYETFCSNTNQTSVSQKTVCQDCQSPPSITLTPPPTPTPIPGTPTPALVPCFDVCDPAAVPSECISGAECLSPVNLCGNPPGCTGAGCVCTTPTPTPTPTIPPYMHPYCPI